MKPIEPGCVALMIGKQFYKMQYGIKRPTFMMPAHQVTVGKQYEFAMIACDCCGSLSKKWRIYSPRITNTGEVFACCECHLTRIDGGDPDAITETEKELSKCD